MLFLPLVKGFLNSIHLFSYSFPDSAEVKEWMKELDGWDIPGYQPNVADAMCDSNPEAKADAANRGWWTCAPGVTRATDINSMCQYSST